MKNMVKLKNRVFKAGVIICIVLVVFVSYAQTIYSENLYVFTNVEEKENFLGEPPEAEWNETFGGTNFDEGYSVQQTSDGGYIITGRTSSYGAGGHDVWLIKTDSNGIEEWNQTFGGQLYDYGYSVQQTTDGGYIIAGFNGGGHFDVWLIKTNHFGFKEWDKIFGGIATDGGYSVQQTTDGGYIVIGITSSYGAGGSDAWLIKTDSNGSKEWDEFFGGTDLDIGFSVQQTGDGGYFITGYNLTYATGNYEAWLIKTDSNGSKEWDETFGDTDIDAGNFGQQTSDGGYIVTGRTGSYSTGDHDVWLIRIETENSPPYEPSEPIPENNSINVNIDTNISWTGGDPDEDTVTYDIYFGTTNPPSKIASNHTETTFELDLMDYNTTYYWQIVAWDYYVPCKKGPIWSFTTENTPLPDLECEGSLSWTGVQSGDTITGSFTVENVGDNGTFLNWGIVIKPSWGEWSFDPDNGDDLETGFIQTVMVTVIAPSEKNEEFIGEIMIINVDEPSDSCTIDVYLATPKNKPFNFNFHFLSWLFERCPNAFPILRQLLEL